MPNISSKTQYRDLVTSTKEQIRTVKSKTTLSANRQLIELYFLIGKEIVITKQEELGWGYSLVAAMAKDLQEKLPAELERMLPSSGEITQVLLPLDGKGERMTYCYRPTQCFSQFNIKNSILELCKSLIIFVDDHTSHDR